MGLVGAGGARAAGQRRRLRPGPVAPRRPAPPTNRGNHGEADPPPVPAARAAVLRPVPAPHAGQLEQRQTPLPLRLPDRIRLANHTAHPRSIYLREEQLVPTLDRWLLRAFEPA